MAPAQFDTIVMANLGYFQLKAHPGAWLLRLRKGRSRDIFNVLPFDGSDSHSDANSSYVGMFVYIFAARLFLSAQ